MISVRGRAQEFEADIGCVHSRLNFEQSCQWGYVFGDVRRATAMNARGPGFDPEPRQSALLLAADSVAEFGRPSCPPSETAV